MYTELAQILAGIRFTESGGNYAGNYGKRMFREGEEYIGAYGLPRSQWTPWSTFAGLKNAPIGSPEAQDRVAASVLTAYKERYGSWDLAIVAWFAGPEQANKLAAQGGIPGLEQYSPETAKYLDSVVSSSKAVPAEFLKTIRPDSFALSKIGTANWVMPVAGESKWSRGSYMDKHTKHDGSHHAIDVYAAEGTPIVSPVAGKVIATGSGGRGGNWARILGNDGVTYYFAHMAAEARVAKGQPVRPGIHIGYVGDTGSAKGTSPHLHFSMRKGNQPINPSQFLEGAAAYEWNQTAQALGVNTATIETPRVAQGAMMTSWLQGLSAKMAGGNPVLPERVMVEEGASLEDAGLNDAKVRQPMERESGLETPRDAQAGEPL